MTITLRQELYNWIETQPIFERELTLELLRLADGFRLQRCPESVMLAQDLAKAVGVLYKKQKAEETQIKCELCGNTAKSVDDAIEQDWLASIFLKEPSQEQIGQICYECQEKVLDPHSEGEFEVRSPGEILC